MADVSMRTPDAEASCGVGASVARCDAGAQESPLKSNPATGAGPMPVHFMALRISRFLSDRCQPTNTPAKIANVIITAFLLQALAAGDIDRAITSGIQRGVFPGAAVVVGTKDSILFARGYGHFAWSPASPVPDPRTTL